MDASTRTAEARPVVCLGQEFANDSERREHYRVLLREHLADPEFRKTPGFPMGSDEDIVRMSDPPYYTACPNPFLTEFITEYRMPYNNETAYSRGPLAIDVSVGKTDALYKAHGYHTKVPHQAIVPSILHYTMPGDIVLDGFAGSGMTGVASIYCGTAPESYRKAIEKECHESGRTAPLWGERRAIVNDLSPAASFIAANYTTPFDVDRFSHSSKCILEEVRRSIGWMYTASTGEQIDYTVWSEVFSCPNCDGEIVFTEEALNPVSKATRASFPCPHCRAVLNKDRLQRVFTVEADPADGSNWSHVTFRPVAMRVSRGKTRVERPLTPDDHLLLQRIAAMPMRSNVPTLRLPVEAMAHGSRIAPKGFTNIHHFYLPRARQALGLLWDLASQESDERIRKMLLFAVEQSIWGFSILNRYSPTHFSHVNQYLNGVYYVGSQHAECSPWYNLESKFKKIASAFAAFGSTSKNVLVGVGTAGCLKIPESTVDYIFTDPPFGENIYYADLNFLVEGWHNITTSSAAETIVDSQKKKSIHWYQQEMQACFTEYFRVLKPGRWMTVVFSNSKASVWNSIQVALQQAGFVVAEVTALDKTQGSYRQVTSASATRQDLVVSCYKPNGGLEDRFYSRGITSDTAWDFVSTHLKNLAVVKVNRDAGIEAIAERDPRRIFDRMVAWFVRHNTPVPISSLEFQAEIVQRFPERDGMIFLPNQVDEYDRARLAAGSAPQKELFVDDERSAIDWLTDALKDKPATYQEISPDFIRKIGAGWRAHETRPELGDLLESNFLRYDGSEPVPPQIHTYLSTNWRDLRNLRKDDSVLVARAKDRWYVPDPKRAQDVERKRERALLKEFEGYKAHKGRRLREFRLEVMRTGFKAAYAARDYATIIEVADKVPEEAWQEDEKLLTFYDLATTRMQAGDGQRR